MSCQLQLSAVEYTKPFKLEPGHLKLAAYISISPSNTVTAGPVIITGAPPPAHDIPRSPPRVVTVTRRDRAGRA